ncbi:hypothetical protein D6T65_05035 [Arthrobacter frigidicola]|nr:hypothetical protein D6T65_05035 [Arthrobacter frigidicola]
MVSLPGAADQQITDAAALVDVEGLTFATMELDNRNGEADLLPLEVNAYTVDGVEVQFMSAEMFLKGLNVDALETEQYNEMIDLTNSLNEPVSVGESRTVTFVSETPLPDDIVRVAVTPDSYAEPVEASFKG